MTDEVQTTPGGPEAGQTIVIQAGTAEELAAGVHVIPDQRINLVPNVGIVVGEDAVLVVDTGMGPRNGQIALDEARKLAGGKPLCLTLTHFHPEHAYGAQSFKPEAVIVYNEAQRTDLRDYGQEFIEMFSGFGEEIAEILSEVRLVDPNIVYADRAEVDLGGRVVQLVHMGGAHTRGDQIVFLPAERILFTGDLVENRFFPIVFGDDSNGPEWLRVLDRLEELEPAVVVPGHGAVGDVGLIQELRDYLVLVHDGVRERIGDGQDVETIAAEFGPEVQRRYEHWDNSEWVDFAIRNFHRELA